MQQTGVFQREGGGERLTNELMCMYVWPMDTDNSLGQGGTSGVLSTIMIKKDITMNSINSPFQAHILVCMAREELPGL